MKSTKNIPACTAQDQEFSAQASIFFYLPFSRGRQPHWVLSSFFTDLRSPLPFDGKFNSQCPVPHRSRSLKVTELLNFTSFPSLLLFRVVSQIDCRHTLPFSLVSPLPDFVLPHEKKSAFSALPFYFSPFRRYFFFRQLLRRLCGILGVCVHSVHRMFATV
jgi:hypothetical protein